MSTKVQCGDKSFKNAIRYIADDVVRSLITLPKTSGYQKHFDRGSKNMSFMIKNNTVSVKV